MGLNFKGCDMTETDYAHAVVAGTVRAGTAAFTPDGPLDSVFLDPLTAVDNVDGTAVCTIKPWATDKLWQRIKTAEAHNVMAIAMDVDAAALIVLRLGDNRVSTKSVDDLRKIVSFMSRPFIVKGVMTAKGAEKAAEAGCYGIVVSNHGGRVIAETPATCEVLPEIRRAVGDRLKIFVDGGIRSGADVFKALALGADDALIGRP
jgi:isopentenyl diphosphate isomerase/L-lactate dehydrogenase-like FMN-dependent dehydrogenase